MWRARMTVYTGTVLRGGVSTCTPLDMFIRPGEKLVLLIGLDWQSVGYQDVPSLRFTINEVAIPAVLYFEARELAYTFDVDGALAVGGAGGTGSTVPVRSTSTEEATIFSTSRLSGADIRVPVSALFQANTFSADPQV